MDRRRDGIIAELGNNQGEIVTFFKGLNSEQLGMIVYSEDPVWTVQQVLAHFITIERTMQWLFKDILAGGPGSPEDFDVDRFNRTQPRKLDGLSLDELIDKFRSVRQDTIAIVEGMENKDLDRKGRHAFHGHGKLERFIVWAYEHARLHLDDIRKILT
ncbi:MAG: DinB family protein [Deltaproteobacteria bacterium]|nr:DinB family protein [Deltaproteobacteria bacterium]